MRRAAATLLLLFLLLASSFAQLPGPPTEHVTDPEGFLSTPVRQALNTQLTTFEKSSGHQVLVWVGTTTGETPLEDWTVDAFQAWRIGRKGLDDGLVLFLFTYDRTARIEVGYGLEEKIPDALASRVLRETILPRLKTDDNNAAVTEGVSQLLTALDEKPLASAAKTPTTPPLSVLQIVLLALGGIGALILAIRYPTFAFYLFALLSRGGGNSGGGGGFGGGGGKSGGGGASGRW